VFIVLLRFAAGRDQAGRLMQAHKAWLQQGFDEGVFLLAGSLQPQSGGVVLAQGLPLPEIKARVDADPFVAENVVSAEIIEIAPNKAQQALAFLLH